MSSSSSASSFLSALFAAAVVEEEDPANPPKENPAVAGGAANAEPEPDDEEVPKENGEDVAVGLLVSVEGPKENPALGAGAGFEEAAAPKLNRDDLLSLSLSDFFSAAAWDCSLVDGAPKAFPNKGLGVTSFSFSVCGIESALLSRFSLSPYCFSISSKCLS